MDNDDRPEQDSGYCLSFRDLYRPGAMDLDRLGTALEVFNALDPGSFYVHHVQMVLFIGTAGQRGVTYAEIEARFRISNASASRSVNALSTFARHRKTAMGLVEIFRDAEEGRRYRVRLTSKGAALLRTIEQL